MVENVENRVVEPQEGGEQSLFERLSSCVGLRDTEALAHRMVYQTRGRNELTRRRKKLLPTKWASCKQMHPLRGLQPTQLSVAFLEPVINGRAVWTGTLSPPKWLGRTRIAFAAGVPLSFEIRLLRFPRRWSTSAFVRESLGSYASPPHVSFSDPINSCHAFTWSPPSSGFSTKRTRPLVGKLGSWRHEGKEPVLSWSYVFYDSQMV